MQRIIYTVAKLRDDAQKLHSLLTPSQHRHAGLGRSVAACRSASGEYKLRQCCQSKSNHDLRGYVRQISKQHTHISRKAHRLRHQRRLAAGFPSTTAQQRSYKCLWVSAKIKKMKYAHREDAEIYVHLYTAVGAPINRRFVD